MNLSNSLLDRIQCHNLEYLEYFVNQHPKAYFYTVLSAALLGYAVLLLFPISAFAGFYQLSNLFSSKSHTVDYQAAIIWYAITVLGISVSYHILTLRFDTKIGSRIKEKRAPRLHQLIQSHNSGRLAVHLHSIQLTDSFELRVAKIPTTGIPLWSENVLLIGFPFMQTMPQRYFDCAISAKLLQQTRFSHPVTHWLAQLAYTWMLYPDALRKRGKIDDHLLRFFFNWYAPFYKSLAQHMVQHSNMLGERYALSLHNDQDILETIEAQAVTEYFLNKYFWPNMLKKSIGAIDSDTIKLQPYNKLPTIIERNLSSATIHKILLRSEEGHQAYANASLRERVNNIGHSQIKPLKVWSGTSGQEYFAKSYPQVVYTMNKKWQAKISGAATPYTESSIKDKQRKMQLNAANA